jgi:hypothetical protein
MKLVNASLIRSMKRLGRIRAFRLGRKKANLKFDPPILFKFPSSCDKSTFCSKYLVDRKLNLSDKGLQAGSKNQLILRAAQKLSGKEDFCCQI